MKTLSLGEAAENKLVIYGTISNILAYLVISLQRTLNRVLGNQKYLANNHSYCFRIYTVSNHLA